MLRPLSSWRDGFGPPYTSKDQKLGEELILERGDWNHCDLVNLSYKRFLCF